MAGCASYGGGMLPVIDRLEAGDPAGALAALEKRPREGDALYQLERGMLLRLSGRTGESSGSFDSAARIGEELYTWSVSREGAALALTDRIAPYRPPAYERLLAHEYAARNYLERGDFAGALVEARRLEALLSEIEDASEGRPSDGRSFACLVAAIAYEAGGSEEDGLRMYRRLFRATRADAPDQAPPAWAEARARSLARRMGFDISPELGSAAPDGQSGEPPGFTAVLFVDRGLVARREETRIDIPILRSEEHLDPGGLAPVLRDRALPACEHGAVAHCGEDGEIGYWLRVALPSYPPDMEGGGPLWGEAGDRSVEAVSCDVSGLARSWLRQDTPRILLRTILRALVKYGVHSEAKEHAGDLGGLLANALGAASEQADTRSWSTLPREISLIVMDLEHPCEAAGLRWRGSDGLERQESVPLSFPEGGRFAVTTCRIWP